MNYKADATIKKPLFLMSPDNFRFLKLLIVTLRKHKDHSKVDLKTSRSGLICTASNSTLMFKNEYSKVKIKHMRVFPFLTLE